MTISAITATWPETAGGWVALIVGALTAFSLIAGAIGAGIALTIRTGRAHIDRKIQVDNQEQVKQAVNDGISPLVVAVDTLRLNREEDINAIMRATGRIEQLEVTINNGLTHATRQTKEDVEELKSAFNSMEKQIAEMHGWMKASIGVPWDGKLERRATGGGTDST